MLLSSVSQHFQESYRYRALLIALVNRYVAIRYRGSVLGYLWSLLNPLCLMLVYTLVFSFYIRLATDDSYAVFLFSGLLPWIWISSSLVEGANSIVASGHLITKSVFPAHILPLVAVTTNLVNFLLSLPVLVIFLLCTGKWFSLAWLGLPVLILLTYGFLYGLTLILASLNVFFRDVQHIVGNLLTLLFFLCPIVYSLSIVPERQQLFYKLNPLALLIQGYQRIWLEGRFYSVFELGYLTLVIALFILIGIFTYDRFREEFAEML